MERAIQDGVKTGRRVSRLATSGAVKRYRKSLTEKYKTIDDLPQEFLDENRELRGSGLMDIPFLDIYSPL